MSPDITGAVPGFSPAKCLLWRAFVMRVPTLILLVVSGVVLLACAAPEGRSSDVAAIQKESASPRLGSQSSPSASGAPAPRSDERRVGKGWGSKGRSRWAP